MANVIQFSRCQLILLIAVSEQSSCNKQQPKTNQIDLAFLCIHFVIWAIILPLKAKSLYQVVKLVLFILSLFFFFFTGIKSLIETRKCLVLWANNWINNNNSNSKKTNILQSQSLFLGLLVSFRKLFSPIRSHIVWIGLCFFSLSVIVKTIDWTLVVCPFDELVSHRLNYSSNYKHIHLRKQHAVWLNERQWI